MKQIYNPTDDSVTIWFGHTPYFVPAKGYCEADDIIAETAVAHNDYKFLKVIPLGEVYDEVNSQAEGTPVVKAGEDQGGDGKVGEKVLTNPWDSAEWNPIEAPWEEVVQYAGKFNIKLVDDQQLTRQNVDEHFLASME